VIDHPDVGVNSQTVLAGGFHQRIAKEPIVRLRGKNSLPVVTALDDVLRLAGNDVAGEACYDELP
jgi:hypothetical protein